MPAAKPNVAALVEQMPETDRDVQVQQELDKLKALPDTPDKPKPKLGPLGTASKFTGPEPGMAERIFSEILGGGRESISELLELVREPSDPDYKSYKAAYVLHGLVILAGRAGQEEQRQILASSIASRLDGEKSSKAVKASLIRELRVLGSDEVVDAVGKQLLDEDLCVDAAQMLLTIRKGVDHFRKALEKSKGRNRVTILQAFGALQDSASVPALKQALTDEDRNTARTAAWALANIGETTAVDALLKIADSATAWERTEATRNCFLLAERLKAAGPEGIARAKRILLHLRETRADEPHVREAAQNALQMQTLDGKKGGPINIK